MAAQLRVYRAEEIDTCDDDLPGGGGGFRPDPAVRVRLGDLLPLVAMAQRQKFIWLKDFLDDEVAISEDLHELLASLRAPTRPGA